MAQILHVHAICFFTSMLQKKNEKQGHKKTPVSSSDTVLSTYDKYISWIEDDVNLPESITTVLICKTVILNIWLLHVCQLMQLTVFQLT